MKRNFTKLLLTGLICLVISACSDSDSPNEGPVIPTDNVADLTKAAIPSDTIGGDPRGTYFGNTPYVFVLPNLLPITDSSYANYTKFYLEIKGDDSTHGTYNYIVAAVRYYVVVTDKDYGTSSQDRFSMDLASNPNESFSGTWQVTGKTITFSEAAVLGDGAYSVNSRGLYIYTLRPTFGNSYYVVNTFKRNIAR
jgi:hypothetical protein